MYYVHHVIFKWLYTYVYIYIYYNIYIIYSYTVHKCHLRRGTTLPAGVAKCCL